MTIYTPITPTYLYIKQHSVTGLKYFGKTTKDPYTYNGSGKHWARHIKKHGKKHIVTLWVSDLFHDTSIVDYALQFSKEKNIVESKEWANMEPENGLNGCVPGRKHTDEVKAKMSKPLSAEHKANISIFRTGKKLSSETRIKIGIASTGRTHSIEAKAKMSIVKKGKILSDETKTKISIGNKGKTVSDEAKAKMSITRKGKPKSDEHILKIAISNTGKKQLIVVCPYCGKSGGTNSMTRYHFDNCKSITLS
jgi:hypothetical protein